MFRLKYISATVMALCAAGATPVWAQSDTPAPADATGAAQKSLQRVEVTGSRIKRIDAETASPVQVITREQIDRSGAQTVTQLLNRLPASNAGNFNSNAVASFTPGAGGVSLRGLGAQATLVLINGRRMAPYGFASGGQQSFFDINSIPLDVVERMEVLLDGASAIYGSDAIAGVINVILRKNYNGLSLSGSGSQSGYHDGAAGKFSTTWGKGDLENDKYNFFLNYSHDQQNAVKASARPMTSTADFRRFGLNDLRSTYGYPGNLYTTGGAFISPMPGCTPLNDPSSAVNGRCYYQGTDHQDLIPETKQDALFGAGTLDLGGGFELFGDALFVRNKYTGESPSYNSATYNSTGTLDTTYITLPVGHPQNPGTTPVALRYRFMDVLHTTEVTADTSRLVVGGRGTVAGWDAESALMYSGTHARVWTNGLMNDSVLTGGDVLVDRGGVANPNFIFGNPGANNPALMAALYPTLHDDGKTSTTSVDVRGSRELMKLPAGGLGLAIGAEFRRESFKSTPDPLTANGDISVLGGSSSDGKRNVSAFFAELSVPITKSLEASLATRTDRYSDFGSATVPKAGIKWKVASNLALRATYAEGFRAPSLTETTQSPSTGFYSLRDPKLCPDPSDTTNPNCDASIRAISGSNPNLKPEKSKSLTAGLVFEPTENVSLSFDAYKIKRRDEIASIDPDYLLANESTYPGYVQRDPVTQEIEQLNLQYTNLGSTRVWGYDIELKARQDLGSAGRVGLTIVYNKMPRYLVANVKDAPEVDYAGTYSQPKERFKAGIDWDIGDWSTTLSGNYTGGFLRAFSPADLSCPYSAGAHADLCRVKAWSTADLYVAYKGIKNLTLSVNIDNIENREAPLDENRVTRYVAYNAGYHSQMGRVVTLAGKYTFW